MEKQSEQNAYEKMYLSFNAYAMRFITFLELLEQLEAAVGIERPSGKGERVDDDTTVG